VNGKKKRSGAKKAAIAVSMVLLILLLLFTGLLLAFFAMNKGGEDRLSTPGVKPSLPSFGFDSDYTFESIEGFVPLDRPEGDETPPIEDNETIPPSSGEQVTVSPETTTSSPETTAPPQTTPLPETTAKAPSATQKPAETTKALPRDADVYYRGEAYNYNEDLINLLVLGIDKKVEEEGSEQADSLYLLVIDKTKKHIEIIAISRSTIAAVSKLDINGNVFGKSKTQICLAYGYGKTPEQASRLTVDAVSGLFYGLPIQGYYTLYLDGIPSLLELIGDVEVTIPPDLDGVKEGWVSGQKATITPETALDFLQTRGDNSNEVRLSRHKDFLMTVYGKLKNGVASQPTLPLTMFGTLKDYSVTDLTADSAVYLATTALSSSFGGIRTLKGTLGMLFGHEAVALDEQALYDLILEIFYIKIS